jgi:hypothetical protein
MYLHVLHKYFADDTETAATSSKQLVVGRHPAGCTQGIPGYVQCTNTLLNNFIYFAIGVPRGGRILRTPRAQHSCHALEAPF